MCQGIPRLVLESNGDRIRVEVDSEARWMKASDGVSGAQAGSTSSSTPVSRSRR